MNILYLSLVGWLLNKKAARREVNISLAFLHWEEIALRPFLILASATCVIFITSSVQLTLLTHR